MRKHTNPLALALALCLLLYIAAAKEWTPKSLPNPMSSPALCGRETVQRSSICDPENQLTRAEKDRIEGVINMIYTGDDPFGERTKGVQVAVVLVSSIEFGYSPETFTRGVHDKWGVGDKHKNDGVVIMVAYSDRDIYISVGEGVPAMTSAAIDRTIDIMKDNLRAGRKGEALVDAVMKVGEFVAGTAPLPKKKKVKDDTGIGLFVVAVLVVFGFIIAYNTKVPATTRLQRLRNDVSAAYRNEYRATSCPVCLDDFVTNTTDAPGNADATTNRASNDEREEQPYVDGPAPPTPASQPDERSLTPRPHHPLSLPCGHTFCEPCLEGWLKEHTTCPICRHDCFPGEQPPRPQPVQPPHHQQTDRRSSYPSLRRGFRFFGNRSTPTCSIVRSHQWGPQVVPVMSFNSNTYQTEFDYRLSRLRSMYPSEVTAHVADTLRFSANQGPEFFTEAVQEQVKKLAEKKGSKGSKSRGFGGGSSSRGGGGRF